MAVISPDIDVFIGAVLLLIGVVLAFFGKLIWATMMSLIGALIGGFLGYLLGSFYGPMFALVLSIIFAVLFSMVFGYLVELGLALVLGLMGFALIFFSFGTTEDNRTLAIVGGVIVLAIVFAIAYYFIEEVIAGATALIGGIIAGAGLYLITYDLGLSIGVGLMIFVFGAIVQIFVLRKHRMRRR